MVDNWGFKVENFLLSVQVYFLYGFPVEEKSLKKTLLQYPSNSQHTEKKIFTHGRLISLN